MPLRAKFYSQSSSVEVKLVIKFPLDLSNNLGQKDLLQLQLFSPKKINFRVPPYLFSI